jgi:HAMP domain-containing protein
MKLPHRSFRTQLLKSFFLVSVIPLLISCVLTVNLFRSKVARDIAASDIEEAERLNGKLTQLFDSFRAVTDQISEDAYIQQALTEGRVRIPSVYASLYRETEGIRNISTVDIYSGRNRIYSTGRGTEDKTLPLHYGVLKRASEHPGELVYTVGMEGMDTTTPTLDIARKINQNDGYVVITMHAQGFTTLLGGGLSGQNGFAVVNRFWEPAFRMGSLANASVLAGCRDNLMNGKGYKDGLTGSFYLSDLGDSGLRSIYTAPPALSQDIISSMYRIILILAAVSMGFCLLASAWMSRALSQPIHELSDAMKRLRHGDLDAHVDMQREDEFGQLAEGFNKTSVRLKTYMEEQVSQQKQLNDTKTAMMQAQLNPHFLYNTLDTIKWVAKEHHVPEIAALSQSLAKILRRSISGEPFCTLEDEIDLLENYCSIQSFRFDNSFVFDYDIPETLMHAVIPKLILQPVVENAIIHGLEGVPDGRVQVLAKSCGAEDKDLEILVTDNGRGISDEMLQMLARHEAPSLSGHLGCRNVDTLLRLNYGDAYGLSARRLPERGTEMRILLPLRLDSGSNHNS